MDEFTFDLIVSVIILLIFIAPYMVTWALPLSLRISAVLWRGKKIGGDLSAAAAQTAPQVLVVGFGPAGREVVAALLEHHLTPVVIDVNPQSLSIGQTMGVHVSLGDAAHEEVLVHAGLADICMAVVTVPDSRTAAAVVSLLRRLRPGLAIAARCRYNRHLPDLKRAGADMIVDEEIGTGKVLAQHIMTFVQETSGQVIACRLAGQEPEVIA